MKLLTTYCKEKLMSHDLDVTATIFNSHRYLLNGRRDDGILRCAGILTTGLKSWIAVNHYKVRTK